MSVKWEAPSAVTTLVSAQTINNAAGNLSAAYDNETNRYRWAAFTLNANMASSPSGSFYLYFICDLNGDSTFEYGGAASQPKRRPDAIIVIPASAAATVTEIRNVQIPPFSFKVLLWNDSGVNSDASAMTLNMEVYNEEIS